MKKWFLDWLLRDFYAEQKRQTLAELAVRAYEINAIEVSIKHLETASFTDGEIVSGHSKTIANFEATIASILKGNFTDRDNIKKNMQAIAEFQGHDQQHAQELQAIREKINRQKGVTTAWRTQTTKAINDVAAASRETFDEERMRGIGRLVEGFPRLFNEIMGKIAVLENNARPAEREQVTKFIASLGQVGAEIDGLKESMSFLQSEVQSVIQQNLKRGPTNGSKESERGSLIDRGEGRESETLQ